MQKKHIAIKDSVVVGKIDGHCEKNDNYSVMNTLFDIDKARRCTASVVRDKNL